MRILYYKNIVIEYINIEYHKCYIGNTYTTIHIRSVDRITWVFTPVLINKHVLNAAIKYAPPPYPHRESYSIGLAQSLISMHEKLREITRNHVTSTRIHMQTHAPSRIHAHPDARTYSGTNA